MRVLFVIMMCFALQACKSEKVTVYGPAPYKEKSEISVYTHNIEPGKQKPTVIVLHNCAGVTGGPSGQTYRWVEMLSDWGYNVVVPDSFSSRGAGAGVCSNHTITNPKERGTDLLYVTEWVRSQPWSNGKVGAIGFSHGGIGILHIANTSFVNEQLKGFKPLDALIAYYPSCSFEHSSGMPNTTLQVHIGDNDDWTLASRCKLLEIVWNKDVSSAEFFFYENAGHGFDMSYGGSMSAMGRTVSFGLHKATATKAQAGVQKLFESKLKGL